jgi:pyruvate dehydrogenase E2 component (dihydrolipoamide acetyltransferase)
LAWRLAEESGVDLGKVRGSGPGGRVVKRDVEAAREQVKAQPAKAAAAPARADAEAESEVERAPDKPAAQGESVEQPSRMRKTIARRMADAKRDVPHFYVGAEIDMSEAMRLREAIKKAGAIGGLTVTHLLLKAVAIALTRHPRVNASWRDETVVFHDGANIGIAVALEDGLVLPVLHGADRLSLAEIADRTGQIVERARQGKFAGEDLIGGTFSVSNVGMIDVDDLVAVINPPQAAILGTGAVKDRPVVRDGTVVVAKTMRATLSCDHRVLNGVEGARFLAELKSLLENPVLLVL